MNFEDAILQKLKEEGLLDSELSLPDPSKPAVEQFSDNLSLEELALRKDYIPEAVANCKRSTEELQNEREIMKNRVVELEIEKGECLNKEVRKDKELKLINIRKEAYEEEKEKLESEKDKLKQDKNALEKQRENESVSISELQQKHLKALHEENILREKERQDLKLIEENKTELEENFKNLYALQEAIKILEKRLNNQKLSQNELSEMKTALEIEIQELQVLLKGLNEIILELKEQAQALQSETQNLLTAIDGLKREILDLEIQRDEAKKNEQTLTVIKKKYEDEKTNVESERRDLNRQIAAEEAELSKIKDQRVKTGGKGGKYETISREPERNAKRSRIQQLRSRVEMLTNRLYMYQDKITEKILEISQAQIKAEADERKANHLKGDLESADEKSKIKEADLAETKTLLKNKQNEKLVPEAKLAANQAKINALTIDLHKVGSELAKLKDKKSSEENEMKSLENNSSELQRHKEELSNALRHHSAEKESINHRLEEISAAQRDRNQELNKLNQLEGLVKMRQEDTENAIRYFSDSLQSVQKEKVAINNTYVHMDRNQKIYNDLLLPQMAKGLEMRLGVDNTVHNTNIKYA